MSGVHKYVCQGHLTRRMKYQLSDNRITAVLQSVQIFKYNMHTLHIVTNHRHLPPPLQFLLVLLSMFWFQGFTLLLFNPFLSINICWYTYSMNFSETNQRELHMQKKAVTNHSGRSLLCMWVQPGPTLCQTNTQACSVLYFSDQLRADKVAGDGDVR